MTLLNSYKAKALVKQQRLTLEIYQDPRTM